MTFVMEIEKGLSYSQAFNRLEEIHSTGGLEGNFGRVGLDSNTMQYSTERSLLPFLSNDVRTHSFDSEVKCRIKVKMKSRVKGEKTHFISI